jgi:hypothetical protein
MKHLLTAILVFFLYSAFCSAQITDKKKYNALSLELGKTGLIYNLNYDRKFNNEKLGFRFAVGSNLAKYLSAFTIGSGGYYLIGKTSKFLEVGADICYLSVDKVSDDQKGFAFVYPNYSTMTYYASLNLGYRRYGQKSLFRIGLSPGFTKQEFIPGGYISFGVTF